MNEPPVDPMNGGKHAVTRGAWDIPVGNVHDLLGNIREGDRTQRDVRFALLCKGMANKRTNLSGVGSALELAAHAN